MTRVYLHIGTHKTGTTSIQAALATTPGINYPDTGRIMEHGLRSPGQHGLASAAIPGADKTIRTPDRDLWDQLEISDPTIISSETFCKARQADVARIRAYLGDNPVKVILYLRNHFAFAASAYKQVVKQGSFTGSFRENVERMIFRLDYDAMIERWSQYFDMDVRFFDKVKRNLLADFAGAVGIEELTPAGRRNVSPDDSILNAVRRIHRAFPGRMNRAKANMLGGRFPGRYVNSLLGWGNLIDASDRAWFKERTGELRGRFLKNHVALPDWHYFEL